MKAANIQTTLFLGLNIILWWFYGTYIPSQDIILTFITFISVLTFHLIFPSPQQQVYLMNKSKLYKSIFPILSLLELLVFLFIPWTALIVFSFSTRINSFVPYILMSHLFHIQTQIALEPIVSENHTRRMAHFHFIALTNFMLRGLGLMTHIIRYYEIYQKEIWNSNKDNNNNDDDDSQVFFFWMNVYTFLSILVWCSANVITLFVWRPCLQIVNPYKDAIVIITGAASGIGKALAENVVKRGVKAIILVDRQKHVAEQLKTQLLTVRPELEVHVHNVDVRDYRQVKTMIDTSKRQYGKIDFLFNNAGILIIGPIEKIGVENFDDVFDVNVKGIHHGIQAVYPIMKEQGFGHIINTSSLLGLIPGGQWAVAYSASKHAIVGLTTNLRIEAARYGVHVSLFCPGTIETPIHTGGEYGKNLTGIPQDMWNQQLAKMKAMDVNSCAIQTLDAVAKNQAIIIVPELPMIQSRLLYRLSPSLWLDRAVAKVDWRRKMEESKKKATAATVTKDEEEKKED